jgi:hypothetical protein
LRWRIEALDIALHRPKLAAWAEFLFNEGAWPDEATFEEELLALEREAVGPPLALAAAR